MARSSPRPSTISNDQRRPIPEANWLGTVYHGLPRELHTFRETPGTYLAFLGRMSPEKGLDKAVEIARRTGLPLKVAGKIAALSRPIVLMAKEAVNRAYETTLAEGVRFERRLFHSTFATEDQKEGMAAFVEKRKPVYKNR